MTAAAGGPDRRSVAAAGHTGDESTARAGLASADPSVRATAVGALERLGLLDDVTVADGLGDADAAVRRRVATIAAAHTAVDLVPTLSDPDPGVVEAACWACGEHESDRAAVVDRLVELARSADEPLVREAAVAALGAIGSERGLDAILAATEDKPAIRRRAVLALAPFDGPLVEAALDRALGDRDWQVRQAAEDLRRAASSG